MINNDIIITHHNYGTKIIVKRVIKQMYERTLKTLWRRDYKTMRMINIIKQAGQINQWIFFLFYKCKYWMHNIPSQINRKLVRIYEIQVLNLNLNNSFSNVSEVLHYVTIIYWVDQNLVSYWSASFMWNLLTFVSILNNDTTNPLLRKTFHGNLYLVAKR